MLANYEKEHWKPGITYFDKNTFQKLTDGIKETENELNKSRCFSMANWRDYMHFRNCKTIISSPLSWVIYSGNTGSTETTIKWFGSGSTKIKMDLATAGYVGGHVTFASVDLTKFKDGKESTVDDGIAFSYFATSGLYTNSIRYIALGTDDNNCYRRYFLNNPSSSSNWKSFISLKKEFTQVGSPDWSNITFFRFYFYSYVPCQNEYFCFQFLGLVRKHLTTTNINPFLEYNPNTSDWKYIEGLDHNDYRWSVIVDGALTPKPLIVNIRGDVYNIPPTLRLTLQEWNDFYLKASLYCKIAGYAGGFGFYIDSNNYIYCHIDNSELKVIEIYKGISTTYTITAVGSLGVDTQVKYYIYKKNDIIRFYVNWSKPVIFEIKSKYKDKLGYLFYRIEDYSKFGYLEDVIITNEQTDITNIGGLAL